ncbi:MAG: serine hydrolase [Bacteroidetes bacterium]|nr:serine hydrolase [Bacteroidota bacterium]MCW5896343.1 serine hydrolase [Bacteroidota bacterium]
MSADLEWDEDISYADTMNSERRMNNSPDAIDFVLGRRLTDIPGTTFKYNGGCTQLLAAIIERATGMHVDTFTYEYLFKPLGITKYTWVAIKDGTPSAASGLRLRSRDLAKFGLLFLNDGMWNGKQIIPSHLVAQTSRSQIATPYSDSTYHTGYSNQFWIPTEIVEGQEVSWIQCQGNGGQIVVIDKQFDLVLVITAGNYDQSDLRKSSWDIYFDFVYPAVVN